MVDLFLQLPGIDGGSTDRGHEGWIELTSAVWGLDSPVLHDQGGGSSAGRPTQHPLVVTALTSIATPLVFEAIVRGTHLPTAALESVRPGDGGSRPAVRWDFEEVSLTFLDVTASQPGGSDAFRLEGRRARLTVFTQDPAGGAGVAVTRGWDFATHQPW